MGSVSTVVEPETREDWQEAVDAAKGALGLHAARLYGLVEGGPAVDVDRCRELINRGSDLGVVPSENSIERFAIALLRDGGRRL